MQRLISFALAALVAACGLPSQHDPATYGTIRVGLGPSLDGVHDWRADQRDVIVEELAKLAALGPEWILVSEGEADVVVRAASLRQVLSDGSLGPCVASGEYTEGLRFVSVDGSCTGGDLALARAVGHELMHWLTYSRYGWSGHICERPTDAPDCHSTIRGPALLNPGLPSESSGPQTTEAFTGAVAHPEPTQADLDLIRTLHGGLR